LNTIKIKPSTPGIIHTFETDNREITFPQQKAIINFVTSSVKTFEVINFIAIGGLFFDCDGNIKDTFLRHETPEDIEIKILNLRKIRNLIEDKSSVIRR